MSGRVHGGFVAAGFDVVAVSAARLSGSEGPTGIGRLLRRADEAICAELDAIVVAAG